jgi:outer membrane protein TolC
MKQKLTSVLLIALLAVATAAASFGVERVIVPDMTFGGATIELSLADAVKIMQTEGSAAENALLNKSADESVAKGYAESARSISEMLDKLDAAVSMGASSIEVSSYAEQAGATELNQKIMQLRRDFAKLQLEPNYKAEMNQIEATTVQTYYGVLQAEENLRIAKENLTNQEKIYNNTMLKYKAGTVARVDTLTAETELLKAKNQVLTAETMVKTAKMNFNLLLGYDLMQQVKLTDTLQKLALPTGNLTGFIEGALDNRNEIKGTVFAKEIQEILLTNLKYRYPTNSSTYLKQQVAFNQSAKRAADAPSQIEMEIRIKYMELMDKERAVTQAQAVLANAKEGARLAVITFDAGMNTLTDVQSAQIMAYQAGQGLAAAITEYDLAIYAFRHATGVGTTRLPL